MDISRLISDMTLMFAYYKKSLIEYREEMVNVTDVPEELVFCNHES
jgi:hypothetical protein